MSDTYILAYMLKNDISNVGTFNIWYYTHLYGEIHKLTFLLYMVFGVIFEMCTYTL